MGLGGLELEGVGPSSTVVAVQYQGLAGLSACVRMDGMGGIRMTHVERELGSQEGELECYVSASTRDQRYIFGKWWLELRGKPVAIK